jgi:hypothetical protein
VVNERPTTDSAQKIEIDAARRLSTIVTDFQPAEQAAA